MKLAFNSVHSSLMIVFFNSNHFMLSSIIPLDFATSLLVLFFKNIFKIKNILEQQIMLNKQFLESRVILNSNAKIIFSSFRIWKKNVFRVK